MLIVDVERRAIVAVDEDDDEAGFPSDGRLRRVFPAGLATKATTGTRIMIEIQRRFGGLAPRALLGAQFIPASSAELVVEVEFMSARKRGVTTECRSRLWRRPFIQGLPEDFAQAVIRGFANFDDLIVPAGILRVDRGGFDEVESSEPVFEQASATLLCAISSQNRNSEIAEDIRALITTWW